LEQVICEQPSCLLSESFASAVTEATGEAGDIHEALDAAPYFGVSHDDAHAILPRMVTALNDWKRLAARSPSVGMDDDEIDKVAPAFENDNWDTVASFLAEGGRRVIRPLR